MTEDTKGFTDINKILITLTLAVIYEFSIKILKAVIAVFASSPLQFLQE
jgi:hypothetical protein